MAQPTQNKRGVLLPNPSGKKWSTKYPLGNIPQPSSGGTPSLSWSATSGLIDGATVNIITDGTYNFGTKTSPSVTIWEDFKSVPTGTLIKDTNPLWVAYNGGSGAGAPVTKLSARYPGSKSVINDGSVHWFDTNYRLFTPSRVVYVSYYTRFVDALGPEDYGVGKFARITTNQSNGNGHYNGPGTHTISNFNPNGNSGYLAYTNSDNAEQNLGWLSYNYNQWNFVEYEFYLNDAGVANGIVRLRVNGQVIYNFTNVTQRAVGNNMLFDSTLLGVDVGGSITGDFKLLQSDTYVDASGFARFVIGDASTISACTQNNFATQPYSNWAGSQQVDIKLNTGGITGPKWLYFYDNTGTLTNTNGVLLAG